MSGMTFTLPRVPHFYRKGKGGQSSVRNARQNLPIAAAEVHQNSLNQHTLVPDVIALMEESIRRGFHGSKFNPVFRPVQASKPGVSSWVQPHPDAATRFVVPDVLEPLNGRAPVMITVKFQTGTHWNLHDRVFTLNSTNDTEDTERTFLYLRVAVAQYTGAEPRDVILTNNGTPIDLKQPLTGDHAITAYFRPVILGVPITHKWDTDNLSEFHIDKYPFGGYRFVFVCEKDRRTIAVKACDWFDGLPMSSRNALAGRTMLFVPGLTSTHLDPIHTLLGIDQTEESLRYDKTTFNQDIMVRALVKLAAHSFAIVPPDKVSANTPQLWMRIRSGTMTIDKHAATKWTGQTGAINQDWSSVCRVCTARAINCNDLAKHMHLHFPFDHMKAHLAGNQLAKRVKTHLRRGDNDDMLADDMQAYIDDMTTVGAPTTGISIHIHSHPYTSVSHTRPIRSITSIHTSTSCLFYHNRSRQLHQSLGETKARVLNSANQSCSGLHRWACPRHFRWNSTHPTDNRESSSQATRNPREGIQRQPAYTNRSSQDVIHIGFGRMHVSVGQR
jgi:hypothetical protein